RALRGERRGQDVPGGGAPGDPHPSGLGAQGALREPHLHHPHRAAPPRGERGGAGLPLPARRDARGPVPLPLASQLGPVLGQPLCAAPRDVGLLPAAAPRAPGDREGRPAVLPALSRVPSPARARSLSSRCWSSSSPTPPPSTARRPASWPIACARSRRSPWA